MSEWKEYRLGDVYEESHRLEEEIKKQLGSIGFKI